LSIRQAEIVQIGINSKTGTCPRHAIGVDDKITLAYVLEALQERDGIGKDADRPEYFQIKVDLFKEWLIVDGI